MNDKLVAVFTRLVNKNKRVSSELSKYFRRALIKTLRPETWGEWSNFFKSKSFTIAE